MTVKITAALPRDDELNGLPAVKRQLIDDPDTVQVVVAFLDCKQTTTDTDSHEITPTARVRRIEVVDAKAGRQLLEDAFVARTGRETLPLDGEGPT